MRQRSSILLYLFFLVFLLAPAARAQEEDDGLTLTARAGFDGAYRGEAWVPLTVRAANDGPDVEGQLRVVVSSGPGDNVVYTQPISLPNRSDKRTTLYVHLPSAPSRLTVELIDAQGRLVREVETNSLDRLGDEPLYAVVSSEPGVWTFLERATATGAPTPTAALLELEELPDVGAAWEALDVLVLNNVDSGRLSAQQLEALRAWVGLGGRLVLTGGAGWQETSAGLQELLPVTVEGVTSVPDLPALEARAGVPFRDSGPYLVAQSTLRSGEVLLRDGDLPLLARRSLGRGAVYFLALDPTLAPLLDWRGSELLWADIGAGAPPDPAWAHGPQNPYSAAGALSGLPALQLPSILGLILFLGLYIGIVGPANYLILRRLGRRELAWITIPGLVLFFSALAYAGGFRLRGNDVILNQVSVAYGAVDGTHVRSSTLLGIFSPRRASYDVHLPAANLVRPFSRDFGALSGTGSEEAISRGADLVLQNVRVDVSGMETYIAHSYRPMPPIAGSARLSLDGSDANIDVDVQNNGQFALQNAGLLVGNGFISIGDLQPGARATQSQPLSSSLASAVTGGSSRFSSAQPLSANYDKILGTSDFYSDREVQARFQLLESLQNYTGPPLPVSTSGLPEGVVTLIAWSQQPQIDVTVPGLDDGVEQQATTLYFLELPIENVVAGGQGVRVPPTLFDWQVESQSGAYINSIADFYLPPGNLDLTYTPWPAFREMDVTDLQINLTSPDNSSATPNLYLWDWQQQTWIQAPSVVWGNIGIGNFEPFIGDQNTVRLRLENTSSQGGVTIEAVHPVLVGDLD